VPESSGQQPAKRTAREEIVDFGAPRRPRSAWLGRLLLATVVVVALVFVLYRPGKHPAKSPSPAPPPVRIAHVGHRVLGISANWDLFGLSSSGVDSIQFGRGLITRTLLPPPLGDAPVSFVIGPHEVIIRPLDNVPGYLVADGRPGRSLKGVLAHGGQLLPGPVPGEEWFITDNQKITLVGPAGQATEPPFATVAAQYPAQSATSDGRGYVVLFNSSGSQYDATPAGLRPVGVLLVAVGPTNWLGLDCEHG
jgi:hypothetical protein